MVHAGGGFFCQKFGNADRRFRGGVEKGRVVGELGHLGLDGLYDGGAIVAHIHAPEAGEPVEQTAVVLIDEVASIAGLDQMGAGLVHIQVVREGMQMILPVQIAQSFQRGVRAHEFNLALKADAFHHQNPRAFPIRVRLVGACRPLCGHEIC